MTIQGQSRNGDKIILGYFEGIIDKPRRLAQFEGLRRRNSSCRGQNFQLMGLLAQPENGKAERTKSRDDEFCFRSDISFFRKRPFFSAYLAVCEVARTDLHPQRHGQAWRTRTSLSLPASPGFLANGTAGPEAPLTSSPHMAAGLWPEGDRCKPVSPRPELRNSFLAVTSEECSHFWPTSRYLSNLAPSAHWQAARLLNGN